MFFKNSRYRKEPSEVTLDVKGRRFKSVCLRLNPDASGRFLHTIEEGDRLDHLAYKYYRAPKKWWQIVDANPEFLSPIDLLDKGVMHTVRIPLTYDDGDTAPPWSDLSGQLSSLTGIDDFRFEEAVQLAEESQEVAGEIISVAEESYERAALIIYNSLNVDVNDLLSAVENAGFTAGQAQSIGRIGKQVVIQPDSI